jgi:hypothetical protein
VILTGFGLWSTLKVNYSGFLIDNLASAHFQPSVRAHPFGFSDQALRTGVLHPGEGVRISNRILTLTDGQQVSACLIIADVSWDYAGAVIANEMSRFQPNAVIMLGVSAHAYLEAGAVKSIDDRPGYDSTGRPDPDNTESNQWLVQNPMTPPVLSMNWDNHRLVRLLRPYLKALDLHVLTPDHARPTNDYICNNVSYLALASALSLPLTLAGGKIHLTPAVRSHPKVGFFHLPEGATADLLHLRKYTQLLLALVQGTLRPRVQMTHL